MTFIRFDHGNFLQIYDRNVSHRFLAELGNTLSRQLTPIATPFLRSQTKKRFMRVHIPKILATVEKCEERNFG